MAVKYFEVSGIGKIRVQKRRGARTMRIRVAQDSSVTVGIPYWVPYHAAVVYARDHTDWIVKHRPETALLVNNQKIGKTHTLLFQEKDIKAPRIKFELDSVLVLIPHGLSHNDEIAQKIAKKAVKKALIKQSHILENKLQEYAHRLGYKFDSSSYKFMKSKWGSCNSQNHITLNYRLLDLPDHLSEYVIIHELVHLNHMNHSEFFWGELSNIIPDYKDRKKQLKALRLAW